MDSKGYDFIIMVKGMKNLVREVVMSVQGSFEQSRSTSIRAFEVMESQSSTSCFLLTNTKGTSMYSMTKVSILLNVRNWSRTST